jgi:hypothetical protein
LEFGQRRLGGQIGFTAVLHTWSQNLSDHYHLHCIVTGGALQADGWKSASPHYLFPVRALSVVFGGKFRGGLERLFAEGALEFHGELAGLATAENFGKLVRQAAAPRWVVYAKKPFAGPRQVLEYLSLYTHRVALSERRLIALDQSQATVSFSFKDYADGARRKIMTLRLEEFLRRFLLHLLPERFVKIRHYGILGNHGRAPRLEALRALLAAGPAQDPPVPVHPPGKTALLLGLLLQPPEAGGQPRCPFCGSWRLRLIRIVVPDSNRPRLDSS